MYKISAALVTASLAFSNSASAAGWLCVTEQSTGFAYDSAKRDWREASFKPVGKFVVKESDSQEYVWEVRQLGDTSTLAAAYCKNQINDLGVLICEGFGNTFRFNMKNLRFIHIYAIGYWTYNPDSPVFKDEGGDTPALSIGKCSAI